MSSNHDDDGSAFDVTVQRPFQSVVIKPKVPAQRPRRAVKLNVDRIVMGGGKYHLLLIPYSPTERFSARLTRTKAIAPLLPKEPNVDGVDYHVRPQRMEFPMKGHLQFVDAKRVELAKEESPWAG